MDGDGRGTGRPKTERETQDPLEQRENAGGIITEALSFVCERELPGPSETTPAGIRPRKARDGQARLFGGHPIPHQSKRRGERQGHKPPSNSRRER